MRPACSFLLLLFVISATASDTTWLNKRWRKCDKDSARYYSINSTSPHGNIQLIYYHPARTLYMQGRYADEAFKIKEGTFKWFTKDGSLSDTSIYLNNLIVLHRKFHSNGQTKTLTNCEKGLVKFVNSWDEHGNETNTDTFYTDSLSMICSEELAYLKGIVNKIDSFWRLDYYLIEPVNALHSSSWYRDRACSKRTKYFAGYYRGTLIDSLVYNDSGKIKTAFYNHLNGVRNACYEYDSTEKFLKGSNWNEQGEPAPLDTSYVYPKPIGGYKALWKKFMKAVNTDMSIDWKYRKDLNGNFYIRFIIDENGKLTTAMIDEPSLYPVMDSLILKKFLEMKEYLPSVCHGRKQQFRGYTVISYMAGKLFRYDRLY